MEMGVIGKFSGRYIPCVRVLRGVVHTLGDAVAAYNYYDTAADISLAVDATRMLCPPKELGPDQVEDTRTRWRAALDQGNRAIRESPVTAAFVVLPWAIVHPFKAYRMCFEGYEDPHHVVRKLESSTKR